MTTATSSKPAEKPEQAPAKVIFQGRINLDLIDVVAQVRKKFDENAHKELTESVRTKDVINPITLRPGKKQGRYELVAGERRYRAAVSAKLTSIPAVVRELDDQAASLYQVEENIHRKDLTPIEEARGFKVLLDAKKFTVEQLAQLVDKSMPYVYRAVHLLELPKDAIEAIEAGEITPAHGHQILRLPPADRTKGVLNQAKQQTAKQLQETISYNGGEDLSKAKFPLGVPCAGEMACTACPYNSGNQGMLFDGAEKGRCLNSGCFTKKSTAHRQVQLEQLRKKYPAAKFVQAVSGWVYANHTQDKGFVIRREFDKPPKGEFALFLSTMDDKLYEATPAAKEKDVPSQRAAAQEQQKKDPKTDFIAEAIGAAQLKALAEKSTKLTKKHLVKIIDNLLDGGIETEHVEAAIGCGLGETDKMTETELCQAITLLVVAPYGHESADVDDLESLGVKVKEIAKTTTKVAEEKFIEFQASKGMEWPKNIKDIDEVLASIISSKDKKWDKFRKSGMTDGELEGHIAAAFPISGGASFPRWYSAKRVGLMLWLGATTGKDRDASLQGVETRNRARIILRIPYR